MINLFCVREKGLNVGNEVIGFAVRALLREQFDDAVNVVPVPGTQGEAGGWHSGLKARTVHEMNLYGHGVVVGGGNLYENGRLDVDLHALRCLQPPLLLLSLSQGRIYDAQRRLMTRTDSLPDAVVAALNEKATASVARDDATRDYLHGLGFTAAVLGGCPTLFLDELLPPAEPTRRGSAGTLLSVRHPELMSVPLADQARVYGEVRHLIERLTQAGHGPVRVLCHDKRDLAFAMSLGPFECVLPDDVADYLELLRDAALVVSFRLHASLPCLSFGTPVINISYDERSTSLVRTLGLEDWDIDFLHERDVTGAVLDRAGRLEDFRVQRDAAQPIWGLLRKALTSVLSDFSAEVCAYAKQAGPGVGPRTAQRPGAGDERGSGS